MGSAEAEPKGRGPFPMTKSSRSAKHCSWLALTLARLCLTSAYRLDKIIASGGKLALVAFHTSPVVSLDVKDGVPDTFYPGAVRWKLLRRARQNKGETRA